MITYDVDFCKNASNYNFESYTIADNENDKKMIFISFVKN